MKLLMSINNKFFDKSPVEFINLVRENDKLNNVAGFELYIDFMNEEEVKYLKDLAFLCDKYNLKIQMHGASEYDIETQFKYMDLLNDIFVSGVSVVLHPITTFSREESIIETNEYFSKVLNYIYYNDYKIKVSIENLNSMVDTLRLSKDYLKGILANNSDLYFTYDIGHEIIEYGKITDIDDILKERLSNVHYHTFNNGDDHKPIGYVFYNKEQWIKGLTYLNTINYDGTVVLEYDFYALGEKYEERLVNYIKCFDFINDYILY